MNQAVNISAIFPKHLFWDVRLELLDPDKDQSLIIPRALYMTNESTFNDDITKLETVYSREEIVENLKSTKERISNRVCEMVAKRYHIPLFYRYAPR